MKYLTCLFITALSISSYSSENLLDLNGRSCELVENNLEITGDEFNENLVTLTFGSGSVAVCGADNFKLKKIFLTANDAEKIRIITRNDDGLSLFGVRKYKIKREFPSLIQVSPKLYQVEIGKTVLKFHIINGKVEAIESDWTGDLARQRNTQARVQSRQGIIQDRLNKKNNRVNLLNEAASIYSNSLTKVKSYYNLRKDISINGFSVARDGCSMTIDGKGKTKKGRTFRFGFAYDFTEEVRASFTSGGKSFSPQYRSEGVNVEVAGENDRSVYQYFYSSSDSSRLNEIFNKISTQCSSI